MDPQENANWSTLYRAAVTERDPVKLRALISQAQYVIGCRARELWYSGVADKGERSEIDAAAHILEAIRMIALRDKA